MGQGWMALTSDTHTLYLKDGLPSWISGMLSVKLSENGLPDFVYSLSQFLGRAFVDEAPAIMMSRSVQRGAERGNRPPQRAPNDGRAAAPAAPRPPPPPPEDAIAQLTGMGFDRPAVVRALQQTDNNVEAAANRLLMG